MIRRLIRHFARRSPKGASLYKRFGAPSGRQWADYLREHSAVYHVGADCSILPSTNIVDPVYTWLGDRVCLGNCTLICHDGSIEVLNQRHGMKLDRVGPIIIEDDVFVGEGAFILGGITVGEGSIIGAGSVLRTSVPAGSVVMGNPAKVVAKVEDVVRFWEADTLGMPWADLIAEREGAFDPEMEPELIRRRQDHFFTGKLRKH